MTAIDQELEFLLSLDGSEFRFGAGHVVRIAAARVVATKSRPHGIKYSLTLHDAAGRRIYGLDNAHGIRRREAEYDHRHIFTGTSTDKERSGRTRIAVRPTYWRIFTARLHGY